MALTLRNANAAARSNKPPAARTVPDISLARIASGQNPRPVISRFATLVLILAAAKISLAADQPSPAAAPTAVAPATATTPTAAKAPPAVAKKKENVFIMPKFEVRTDRVRWLDREIKRIDKMIAREKRKVKSTDLDRALNNEKLVRAAAIFGGNTADHLSAVAATRVGILENEREILEAMKRPATIEEMAMFEEQITQLRILRRELDDAARQR